MFCFFVLVQVEDAYGLVSLRLNQVVPVAVLIGQVEVTDPFGHLKSVEQVAAKGENGVGDIED